MSKRKSDKTRRDFIKNATLALGGFYILPRHVLGGKGFTAPGLINTGGGGGGGGMSPTSSFTGSAGGSGIVIIRWYGG